MSHSDVRLELLAVGTNLREVTAYFLSLEDNSIAFVSGGGGFAAGAEVDSGSSERLEIDELRRLIHRQEHRLQVPLFTLASERRVRNEEKEKERRDGQT